MRRLMIVAALCVFPATVAAQTPLPAWVTNAIVVAEQMAAEPVFQCPTGMSMIPVLTPGKGISYECRPDVVKTRDRLADRLTELNAGLIVLDSTLTGYLVWNGIGDEANPLMKPIFDADKPWRVGLKGAIGAAQMLGIYRVTKPRSKARYVALTLAIAINGYACVNNYRIYRDHRKGL